VDAELHQDALEEVTTEQLADLVISDDDALLVEDNDQMAVMLHRGTVSAIEARCFEVPGTPYDWVPPAAQVSKGGPEFKYINNPGEWSQFTYHPKFPNGTFVQHSLPTGSSPVPPESEGNHKGGDWDFLTRIDSKGGGKTW
jgi:hypothetical protein